MNAYLSQALLTITFKSWSIFIKIYYNNGVKPIQTRIQSVWGARCGEGTMGSVWFGSFRHWHEATRDAASMLPCRAVAVACKRNFSALFLQYLITWAGIYSIIRSEFVYDGRQSTNVVNLKIYLIYIWKIQWTTLDRSHFRGLESYLIKLYILACIPYDYSFDLLQSLLHYEAKRIIVVLST